MRDKIKNGLITVKNLAKEEIGRELGVLLALAEEAPWVFGRYITFETVFLIIWLYAVKTGKKLDWVDPD